MFGLPMTTKTDNCKNKKINNQQKMAENTRAYIGHAQQQRSIGENRRQQMENIELE